jgi:hypothetical protein
MTFQDENVVAYIAKLRNPVERSYANGNGDICKAEIVSPITGSTASRTGMPRRYE